MSANNPFTALSRWRNAQPASLVKRHTLFDVLEPRLLFSAEHPLGLAVGQEEFYEYYRRAEDIELTRDTLYVLDALENKNSNSGIDTAEDISKLAEFNIDSGRQLVTDASYEVGFEQAVDSIPQNASADTGFMLADEPDPQITIDVTTIDDIVDAPDMDSFSAFVANIGPDGSVSLREAIMVANADPNVDTIQLSDETYVLTLDPGNRVEEDANLTGDLDVSGTYSIRGVETGGTVISQSVPGQRIIEVSSGSLSITDLSVKGGSLMDGLSGGGMRVNLLSNAVLSNVKFEGNEALFTGGALYVEGSATLNDVVISGSEAQRGAGIHAAEMSSVSILDSEISQNIASDDGGAIYVQGNMYIYNSLFQGNQASADTINVDDNARGGAIFIDDTSEDVIIQDSVLRDNYAKSDGGAINNHGTLKLIDTVLLDNTAERWGGGLRNDGYATLLRTTVFENKVTGSSNYLPSGG